MYSVGLLELGLTDSNGVKLLAWPKHVNRHHKWRREAGSASTEKYHVFAGGLVEVRELPYLATLMIDDSKCGGSFVLKHESVYETHELAAEASCAITGNKKYCYHRTDFNTERVHFYVHLGRLQALIVCKTLENAIEAMLFSSLELT